MLSKFGRVPAGGRREAKWRLKPLPRPFGQVRAVGFGRDDERDAVQVANPKT